MTGTCEKWNGPIMGTGINIMVVPFVALLGLIFVGPSMRNVQQFFVPSFSTS